VEHVAAKNGGEQKKMKARREKVKGKKSKNTK